MNDLLWWLVIAILTVVLNTIPLFMPPTWMLLAYFHFREGYDTWQLAMVGGVAAATGRAILALTFRNLGTRVLPDRWRANIEELGVQLERHRTMSLSAFGLFLLGPLPSNQMFIAIGIARIPLLAPLAVFMVSRFVGYVFWITTAGAVSSTLSDAVKPSFGGTASIIAQIAGLLVLVAVMQIDWRRFLQRRRSRESLEDVIPVSRVDQPSHIDTIP